MTQYTLSFFIVRSESFTGSLDVLTQSNVKQALVLAPYVA
jgi:hypothetical protein